MQRTISLERLFTLGQYKNMKWIEAVQFDDTDMTTEWMDMLRYSLALNCYLGFAIHNFVDDELKELGEAVPLTPENIIHLIARERGLLKDEEPKFLKLQIITHDDGDKEKEENE